MNVETMGRFFKKHGATILSILAGLGVVATGVSAYVDGKNAGTENSSEQDEQDIEQKRTNPVSIKTISLGTATIGCIAASRYIGYRTEQKYLAALGVLSAWIGTKQGRQGGELDTAKDIRIREAEIEDTGHGDIIFTEEFTGRRFKTSMNCYEYAVRKLQEDFSITGYVSLNVFYGLLDIEETEAGEVLGWTIDQMISDPEYEPGDDFSYEDALTRLAIYTHKIDDNNYIIRYVILPIGSILPIGTVADMAGIGPCNY